MDQIVLEVPDNIVILVENIGGDLRLSGWDQNQFVAESDDDRSLHVQKDDEQLVVRAGADCRLRVPRSARLTLQSVGGDARAKSLEAVLTIGQVGGDLSLRQVGPTEVGRVGGDLKAKKINGHLRLGTVGGDVQASSVEGPVQAQKIGSDLYLRDIQGGLDVRAGGDVALNLNFLPGQEYVIRAGSDLTCRLPADADVQLDISAGGDIEVDVLGAQIVGQPRRRTVTLGAGTAPVVLQAGGDVSIVGLAADPGAMGDFGEQFGDDFSVMAEEFAVQIETQIESQIEAIMPDIDKLLAERLSQFQLQFGAGSVKAEELAERARHAAERVEETKARAADKIRRKAEQAVRQVERERERARHRAEHAARHQSEHAKNVRQAWAFAPRPPVPPTPPVPPRPPMPPAPPLDPVTDEERLVILRMVEQGKISVADAEKLLAALENR